MNLRQIEHKVECPCGVWYDLREYALDCYFQDHPWVQAQREAIAASFGVKYAVKNAKEA